jgi:hypothetical protein
MELHAAYEKMERNKSLRDAVGGGVMDCSACNTPSIYVKNEDGDIFWCQNPPCRAAICTLCNKRAHWDDPCNIDPETQSRKLKEEKETMKLVKVCPRCNASALKVDGCNKMTCNCKCLFCWICGKDVTVEGYAHFQDSDCVLFEDPDGDDHREEMAPGGRRGDMRDLPPARADALGLREARDAQIRAANHDFRPAPWIPDGPRINGALPPARGDAVNLRIPEVDAHYAARIRDDLHGLHIIHDPQRLNGPRFNGNVRPGMAVPPWGQDPRIFEEREREQRRLREQHLRAERLRDNLLNQHHGQAPQHPNGPDIPGRLEQPLFGRGPAPWRPDGPGINGRDPPPPPVRGDGPERPQAPARRERREGPEGEDEALPMDWE